MILAPSILSADFSKLLSEIQEVESYGTKWLHVDVMDGHFVPNMTFGPVVVEALRPHTKSTIDCHLMVNEPEKMVPWFIKAGADYITFHAEATKDPKALIEKIRASGKKAGLSIKPKTPVESIAEFLPYLDLVLIMSVEPGFGGQSFMPDSLNKSKWLAAQKKQKNYSYLIEIDGGINTLTAQAARAAGVEVFVAGSAIFGAKDRKKAYQELENAIR
jgi:ribulose-phosphate 3-epimerase